MSLGDDGNVDFQKPVVSLLYEAHVRAKCFLLKETKGRVLAGGYKDRVFPTALLSLLPWFIHNLLHANKPLVVFSSKSGRFR